MESALKSTASIPQASSKLRNTYSAQSCENTQGVLQADWIRTQIDPLVRTATAVYINQLPRMDTILEQQNAQNMAADLPRCPKCLSVNPNLNALTAL
jgi:hypothetical protein